MSAILEQIGTFDDIELVGNIYGKREHDDLVIITSNDYMIDYRVITDLDRIIGVYVCYLWMPNLHGMNEGEVMLSKIDRCEIEDQIEKQITVEL